MDPWTQRRRSRRLRLWACEALRHRRWGSLTIESASQAPHCDQTKMVNQEVLRVVNDKPFTVGDAFEAAQKLCKEKLTYEAKDLLELTLARFKAVRDMGPSNGISLTMFVQVLGQFYTKLLAHSTMSLAARVIDHKYLINELTAMHHSNDSLDAVLRHSGLHEQWVGKQAFEKAKSQYEEKLDKAVVAAVESWKTNLVIHKAVLEQSARALKTAKESRDSMKWDENQVARNMEVEVKKLAEEAVERWRAAQSPSWFIAENTITCQTKIGNGTFGTVYIGTWGGLDGGVGGAQVAIKRQTLNGDESAIKMQRKAFAKEVSLWEQLKHPYVLKLFGANCDANEPFMVCEYGERGNLAAHLGTPDGKRRKWRHLYHVALGIAYLHEKSVIHGDLKLDNFVVGNDNFPRVADFSTTRQKQSANIYASRQEEGVVSAGALRWRAPECVGADAVAPQLPSDVYSFGMCIYEVYKGPLYGFLDHKSAAEMIQKGELPKKPTDIPNEVWDLIKKMTCKEPSERITMQAVAVELWAFADEEQKKDEKEKPDKFVCTKCTADIQPNSGNRCPHCHTDVKTAHLKIESKADLPRVMELLSSQALDQRRNAMQALQSYICQDLVQQKEVYDASAISVLAQIVKRTIEDEEIQREALITLACVVVGNDVAQNYANTEQTVTRLMQIVRDGPEPLKCKAANSLGYMSYRNQLIYDAVLKEADLLKMIGELNPETDEGRRDKNRALKMLTPPEQTQPQAAAVGG